MSWIVGLMFVVKPKSVELSCGSRYSTFHSAQGRPVLPPPLPQQGVAGIVGQFRLDADPAEQALVDVDGRVELLAGGEQEALVLDERDPVRAVREHVAGVGRGDDPLTPGLPRDPALLGGEGLAFFHLEGNDLGNALDEPGRVVRPVVVHHGRVIRLVENVRDGLDRPRLVFRRLEGVRGPLRLVGEVAHAGNAAAIDQQPHRHVLDVRPATARVDDLVQVEVTGRGVELLPVGRGESGVRVGPVQAELSPVRFVVFSRWSRTRYQMVTPTALGSSSAAASKIFMSAPALAAGMSPGFVLPA